MSDSGTRRGSARTILDYSLVVLLLICALSVFVFACDKLKLSENAQKTADIRRGQIGTELTALAGKHDWAGEYYEGDGLGENVSLILSPKAGYVFEWHGCLGVYDRNYGSVTAVDGILRLSFTFENERKGFQGIASEFIPISWGSRKYLIPSNEVVGFCNEVNARAEPRDDLHGRYLLRVGDEKKTVTGWPKLPRQYEAYLLERPVEAKITKLSRPTTRPSAGNWNFRDTVVKLDAGRADRLLVGMELHVIYPEHVVESARVIKVDDHAAEAVMTQIGEDEPGPRIGWRLSTLPSWRRQQVPRATQPAGEGPDLRVKSTKPGK